jgi:hypothetical protein
MQFAISVGKGAKKKALYSEGKLLQGEVGLQTINWDALGETTYNPDDVGVATYKKMMKDAQVRMAYNFIKFATLSRQWKVILSETEKKSEDIIGFLRYVF